MVPDGTLKVSPLAAQPVLEVIEGFLSPDTKDKRNRAGSSYGNKVEFGTCPGFGFVSYVARLLPWVSFSVLPDALCFPPSC